MHNIMSSHEASTRTSLGNIERGMGKIHGAVAALLYVIHDEENSLRVMVKKQQKAKQKSNVLK